MKKIGLQYLVTLFLIFAVCQPATADLNRFLTDLNNKAKADINHFNSVLSTQFKIPVPDIQVILKTVKDPADVFMCLQLSQMTGVHRDTVVSTYRRNSGQGWGVIAKELGIKPGSPEFHALKQGDFVFGSPQKTQKSKGKGKGKDKSKGKKKK